MRPGVQTCSTAPTVLFVGLVTGTGGDAVQMLDLAVGMRDSGLQVRIAVPEVDTTAGFADQCRAMDVPVERTGLLRVDILGARQDAGDVMRFLRSHRADVVHFHTGNDCLPRSILLGLAFLRFPKAFVTLHGPYASLRVGGIRARTWAALAPGRFHKVICPSESSMNAQLRYGLPVHVLERIPNGVNVRKYAGGDGDRARAELSLPGDAPLIVFTSRMDPQKRPLDLVEAFSRIADDFPASHLVFVGSGALEGEAERSATRLGLISRVHLVGHRTDIPDWLAAATVWVLPTESESFGLAIVEALAAGCPVVTTRCRGTDEYLVDDGNALLFAVGDVEAMASRLRQILFSAKLRSRLAAAGRRTAQDFSIARSLDGYLGAYASARA